MKGNPPWHRPALAWPGISGYIVEISGVLMIEKYVIIHRTHDPFQADLLGDLLRENGIAARVLGTRHGAAIGVGQNILEQHIEVPQSQAGEATDFLESYFESDGASLLDEQIGLDEEPEDEPAARAGGAEPAVPLRPLFAGAATSLLFGGSHLYARRPWTALVLAAGQVLALANLRSMQWHTVATGLVMFLIILLTDLCGGQVAVRSYNRAIGRDMGPGNVRADMAHGVRVSPVRQLALGVVLVALAGTVGALVGPHMPAPKRDGQRTAPATYTPASQPAF